MEKGILLGKEQSKGISKHKTIDDPGSWDFEAVLALSWKSLRTKRMRIS